MIEHFSDADFSGKLQENKVVVADFSATWCGPCRALAPVIDELAAEYDGKALIGKADVDECPELSEKYAIMSVPTVIFFKNGEAVERIVGVSPKSNYVKVLDSII